MIIFASPPGSTREDIVRAIAFEAMQSARVGDKVAIFASTLKVAQELAAPAFESVLPEELAKVRQANGDARVTFPHGGRVYFRSLRQSARGVSLDRAYVPMTITDDQLLDLTHCLHTSPQGQIIGYFEPVALAAADEVKLPE